MARDFKDLCIETLADSEAELRERVFSLEQDVAIYRALAQTAIHRVAKLTKQNERLTARLYALLEKQRSPQDVAA